MFKRLNHRATFASLACAGLLAAAFSFNAAAEEEKESGLAIKVGKKAPNFSLPNQDEKAVKLSDYKGKWVVLYFYPKDDTPGCTTQACDFTDGIKDFEKLNAVVLGCSPDSPESHRRFIAKHDLKITLLSDPQRAVMTPYGGSKDGRTIRSTVIIDPKGVVAAHYPQVRPAGHAEELKKKLAELKASS